jgi:hypothetical protein
MSTAGAGLSPSGGTTCASLDGRTGSQLRNRVANSTSQGLVWENASESCLMSLSADTGNLFVKGMYSAGGTGGLMCSISYGGRSLGSFLTTGTLTGNANAPLNWGNMHSLAPLASIFNGINSYYAVRLTGYINIQYAQQYTFYFNIVDDTAAVYIDGILLLAQLNYSGAQSSANYTFASSGWKPIHIYHTQGAGGESLRLQWSTTGTGTIVQQDIPASSLAYDQSEAKPASLGGPLYYNDATFQVGVGNTNPAYLLDVAGSFRATGAISLPASSVGVAAISGLATIATTGAATNLSGVLGTGQIPSLPASQITSGSFSVGAFGSKNLSTTGTLTAGGTTTTGVTINTTGTGLAINNFVSTGNTTTMTNYTPSLATGQFQVNYFGTSSASHNSG